MNDILTKLILKGKATVVNKTAGLATLCNIQIPDTQIAILTKLQITPFFNPELASAEQKADPVARYVNFGDSNSSLNINFNKAQIADYEMNYVNVLNKQLLLRSHYQIQITDNKNSSPQHIFSFGAGVQYTPIPFQTIVDDRPVNYVAYVYTPKFEGAKITPFSIHRGNIHIKIAFPQAYGIKAQQDFESGTPNPLEDYVNPEPSAEVRPLKANLTPQNKQPEQRESLGLGSLYDGQTPDNDQFFQAIYFLFKSTSDTIPDEIRYSPNNFELPPSVLTEYMDNILMQYGYYKSEVGSNNWPWATGAQGQLSFESPFSQPDAPVLFGRYMLGNYPLYNIQYVLVNEQDVQNLDISEIKNQ